jgi:uncharacterized paraquat-inducible protein A
MNQDKKIKTGDTTKENTRETRPLEGEVTCFHCSKVQTYEELLKNGDCMQCGTNLIGELF